MISVGCTDFPRYGEGPKPAGEKIGKNGKVLVTVLEEVADKVRASSERWTRTNRFLSTW
jgi:hypothetical protein